MNEKERIGLGAGTPTPKREALIAELIEKYFEEHPVKDGKGISKAEINGNGELVITYTDNTTTTVGKVVGGKGEPGAPGKDYVLTEADKQEIADMIPIPDGGGGSGEWELIVDYTVPEDTVIDILDFTKDMNGNDFNLKRVVIYFVSKSVASPNNDRGIYCLTSKESKTTAWDNGVQIAKVMAKVDAKQAFLTYGEVVGDSYFWYRAEAQNNTTLWNGLTYFGGTSKFDEETGMIKKYGEEKAEINRFRIRSLNSDILGAGSTIKIMGVRK